jgi:hypothetical protein
LKKFAYGRGFLSEFAVFDLMSVHLIL